jgi:trans-2-enoyl-CoA reductase
MALSATKRLFSEWVNRAIVYSENGDPAKVLTSLRYPSLPVPASNTVNIQVFLAPINPADLNVIEGIYPSKPRASTLLTPSLKDSENHPVFVAGNEGLARVTAVGNGVNDLKEHDWVVMAKPQVGTWCTGTNIDVADVIKIPRGHGLSEVHGATLTVSVCYLYQANGINALGYPGKPPNCLQHVTRFCSPATRRLDRAEWGE